MEEENTPSPVPVSAASGQVSAPKSKPPRAPGLPPLAPKQNPLNAGGAEDGAQESSEPIPCSSHTETEDEDDARSCSTSPSCMHTNLSNTISFTQHVLVIQQIRELVKALVRMDHPHMYAIADAVATLIRKKMRERAAQREEDGVEEKELTPGQVEALKVVLQTLQDACFFEHYGTPTIRGTQAVTLLRATVFGSEASDASAVLASVDKARAFYYACLTLCKRCITAQNCLEILRLGHIISAADLEEMCTLFCITNFSAAIKCSPMDWVMLEDDHVLQILSSQYLKCDTEWQVWEAVVLWTMKDTSHRASVVPLLLQHAVRLEELEVLQLQQLNTNPLVKCNPRASDLVASAYTRRMLSSVHKSHKAAPKDQSPSDKAHGPNHHKQHARQSGGAPWRQDTSEAAAAPGIMIQSDHLQSKIMVPIAETQEQPAQQQQEQQGMGASDKAPSGPQQGEPNPAQQQQQQTAAAESLQAAPTLRLAGTFPHADSVGLQGCPSINPADGILPVSSEGAPPAKKSRLGGAS